MKVTPRRNRASSLSDTLEAIGRLNTASDFAVELLVVDNGSTDRTPEVVRETSARLPVSYVHESRRGQNHAYNTAIAHARGDIILFTDDDVRPPPDWVRGMCRPIVEGEADAVVGGVTLAPHLRRRWLIEGFPAYGACTPTGESERVDFLVGANMAISRKVLRRVPAFDPELGPGALGFHGEMLFARQLRRAGYTIRSAFDVAVEHHFECDRLRPDSVKAVAEKMGRSTAYVAYHWEHASALAWPWRDVFRRTCAYTYRRIFNHKAWECDGVPPYWALDLISTWAFVRQYLKERRRRRNYEQFGLRRKDGVEVASGGGGRPALIA